MKIRTRTARLSVMQFLGMAIFIGSVPPRVWLPSSCVRAQIRSNISVPTIFMSSDRLNPLARQVSNLASVIQSGLPSQNGLLPTEKSTTHRRVPVKKYLRCHTGSKQQYIGYITKNSSFYRKKKAQRELQSGQRGPRRGVRFMLNTPGRRQSQATSMVPSPSRRRQSVLQTRLATPPPTQRSVSIGQLHHDTDDTLQTSFFPDTPTPLSCKRARTPTKDFAIFNEQINECYIEGSLIQKLCEGPGSPKASAGVGHLYCMSRSQSPGYVKIGRTGGNIFHRRNSLSPKERFGTLKPEADPDGECVFRHYEFAERLVQLELWNERRKSLYMNASQDEGFSLREKGNFRYLRSKAESGRTEWFQIGVKDAHSICAKWRVWLSQCKPYDKNGKLDEFWRTRFQRQTAMDPYSKSKHKSLHLRWSALLNPRCYERYLYNLGVAWSETCKYYAWIRAHMLSFGAAVWGTLFVCLRLWYGLNQLAVMFLDIAFFAVPLLVGLGFLLQDGREEDDSLKRSRKSV